uniref:Fibronectin type-III domain-containing protein n=1 Tax=Zonotrichia albicollis TaxID=44394 RepID=A0A8D2MMM6_ZONAL
VCPFACPATQPTPSTAAIKLFIVTRMGWLLSGDTGECTLTGPQSCSFGDLQVFSLTPYELNVTARNPLGAASGALPFLLENIIKPDPPEALRVSPIPGEPQKLLLEWNPPSSWPFPEYFPLHYCIRYSWDNDSVPTTVGPYELTSHTLTDLDKGKIPGKVAAAFGLTLAVTSAVSIPWSQTSLAGTPGLSWGDPGTQTAPGVSAVKWGVWDRPFGAAAGSGMQLYKAKMDLREGTNFPSWLSW